MDNSKVQTLRDLIRYGKTTSFSLPLISLLNNDNDIIYLDEVVYAKYEKLLFDNSFIIDLTINEYNKYRLDPKLLSNDIYGTPNLYHLILYLNNVSEFEFDIKRIRLLTSENINNIFKLILSHEENNINKSIINSRR